MITDVHVTHGAMVHAIVVHVVWTRECRERLSMGESMIMRDDGRMQAMASSTLPGLICWMDLMTVHAQVPVLSLFFHPTGPTGSEGPRV